MTDLKFCKGREDADAPASSLLHKSQRRSQTFEIAKTANEPLVTFHAHHEASQA